MTTPAERRVPLLAHIADKFESASRELRAAATPRGNHAGALENAKTSTTEILAMIDEASARLTETVWLGVVE